ncbi:MAG: hypothetical protein JWN76_3181, partial [Chitinophagaceae bacterium]|nr:hypothetical protein [Chitinophagaceae bacterium]
MRDTGIHIIAALKRKWITLAILKEILIAASLIMIISAILYYFIHTNIALLSGVSVVAILVAVFIRKPWNIDDVEIVKFLDRAYPQLEESSGLLLSQPIFQTRLQELQFERTREKLHQLNIRLPYRQIKNAASIFAGAIIFTFLLSVIPVKRILHAKNPGQQPKLKQEIKLPGVDKLQLTIIPPAYTGKGKRLQEQFNIECEEDAILNWAITTTSAANSLEIILNDKQVIALQPLNGEHKKWSMSKTVTTSGYYQVKLDNQLSELYRISVIKDKAPAIKILKPKPYNTVEYGESTKIPLQVNLSDDYGITNSFISATIASGSAESVKFKEQQLSFNTSFKSFTTNTQLNRILDLKAMGLQPGDELYFYITAKDNNVHESRSDVYIIQLADTSQLMSMPSLMNGVNLKPEYFRSQRQIIIETEQLIKDKDKISAEEFNNKSNDLGMDQKLLRLRYGKFLGEENEVNIGDSRFDSDEDIHAGNNESQNQKIIDAYSHKHDIAEDPNFFEPETKKQLKATLAEMWNAELKLRILKPVEALPYEYKALRLLKDLQQKSRSYVAKTGYQTTP